MMGTKERAFRPLPPATLEDLVPQDHFYRHLERTLDLGFVRDLVRGAYAEVGRPSIDGCVQKPVTSGEESGGVSCRVCTERVPA